MLLFAGLLLTGCQATQFVSSEAERGSIPEGVIDPTVWGKAYPDQYASYLKNSKQKAEVSHFATQPLLPELFKGYPFAKEYNETKGHTSSLADAASTKRVSDKTTAGCLHCHSADFPRRLAEYGPGFYAQPFSQMKIDQLFQTG